MRYLTLGEVVALHRAVIDTSGGATGVRDLAALESALAQEVFLALNGVSLNASVDEQEALFLGLAAGRHSRGALEAWLELHITINE